MEHFNSIKGKPNPKSIDFKFLSISLKNKGSTVVGLDCDPRTYTQTKWVLLSQKASAQEYIKVAEKLFCREGSAVSGDLESLSSLHQRWFEDATWTLAFDTGSSWVISFQDAGLGHPPSSALAPPPFCPELSWLPPVRH